jgi:hypothetical protein
MQIEPIELFVPRNITFADLGLARATTGTITFNWWPLEAICDANGFDFEVFKEGHEDVGTLLISWYLSHLEMGGDKDPTAEELIAEVRMECESGQDISFAPGRA